jgi:hypothetical protein
MIENALSSESARCFIALLLPDAGRFVFIKYQPISIEFEEEIPGHVPLANGLHLSASRRGRGRFDPLGLRGSV